eukprot:2561173-Pyramimonas_sp.AAC.1
MERLNKGLIYDKSSEARARYCFREFAPEQWGLVSPLGPAAAEAVAKAMAAKENAAERFPHAHASEVRVQSRHEQMHR